jgi:putative PIN family toxin of toxin-antitoxin system
VKTVLDTNVLVSGLLNPHGPPGCLVQMVANGELSLCFDARILCEYRDVLLRPTFGFQSDRVQILMEQIRAVGMSTGSSPLPRRLPDPDDDAFLEVAIAAKVEYLVTGNLRHYPVQFCPGIQVVSPARFLEIYRTRTKLTG